MSDPRPMLTLELIGRRSRPTLPPPAERRRLREAFHLAQADLGELE